MPPPSPCPTRPRAPSASPSHASPIQSRHTGLPAVASLAQERPSYELPKKLSLVRGHLLPPPISTRVSVVHLPSTPPSSSSPKTMIPLSGRPVRRSHQSPMTSQMPWNACPKQRPRPTRISIPTMTNSPRFLSRHIRLRPLAPRRPFHLSPTSIPTSNLLPPFGLSPLSAGINPPWTTSHQFPLCPPAPFPLLRSRPSKRF